MTNQIITNNVIGNSMLSKIELFSSGAHRIVIAVAFLSDTGFINNWLKSGKKVLLIVSLRPPTDYYYLKKYCTKKI